jgi:hypothetical protein
MPFSCNQNYYVSSEGKLTLAACIPPSLEWSEFSHYAWKKVSKKLIGVKLFSKKHLDLGWWKYV